MPSFTLQKAAYRGPKGGISQAERQPFGGRKAGGGDETNKKRRQAMKSTILTIAALAAAACAGAQTIDDVLSNVEHNNIALKAALKGNEAADMETRQENAIEDLSVEYSPFFHKDATGIASSELVVTQGFDFPTLYGARRKAARLKDDVRRTEYMTARRDVLLEAKTLCLDLVHLDKQKEILAERRRIADELLAKFTEKYDNGDATSIELNKIKMERMNLATELAAAETARAAALTRLKALNGGKPVELDGAAYPALPVGGAEEIYARAVAADLQVMAAEASVKAAEQDVKVSKQGWMPKLEIGYRRNTDGRDASNGFLVGGSIPLFSNKNKVRSAKARRTEAELRRADARAAAESAARASVDEMVRLEASMQAYDVPLMRETLRLLRTAVDNGEISVTDYYVEADNVYRNLLAFMSLERQYQGVVAEVTKNEL